MIVLPIAYSIDKQILGIILPTAYNTVRNGIKYKCNDNLQKCRDKHIVKLEFIKRIDDFRKR